MNRFRAGLWPEGAEGKPLPVKHHAPQNGSA